jgi:hypothetical protein
MNSAGGNRDAFEGEKTEAEGVEIRYPDLLTLLLCLLSGLAFQEPGQHEDDAHIVLI